MTSYDEVCKKLISFLDINSKFYKSFNEDDPIYYDMLDAAVSCFKVINIIKLIFRYFYNFILVFDNNLRK